VHHVQRVEAIFILGIWIVVAVARDDCARGMLCEDLTEVASTVLVQAKKEPVLWSKRTPVSSTGRTHYMYQQL
jgi:hypothetical protein